MILERINEPRDLKTLSLEELNILKEEIRHYLIEVVEENGGHLASNLGVVELTIALHYVFNSPVDSIIFDVGHQSYTHKILTGRREAMRTLRKKDGISGFNKRSESVHDAFGVGHSSTSISAALGFYYAKQMKGELGHVVSVIGDGAMTAGLAFEGLNNSGHLDKNFIVILNDNQMSIGQNVGGMSRYLNKIRTAKNYQDAKKDLKKAFDKVPVVGAPMKKVTKDLKDALKQVVVAGMMFEEMGYTYLGPIDGHNIKHIVTALKQAKRINGPVLVHLRTKKGKGHSLAESNPMKYHGVKAGLRRMVNPSYPPADKTSARTYGDILAKKLTDYKRSGSNIAAISAAMPHGTGLYDFGKKFQNSFFDVGIAEQHAVTFAAGLALNDVKPFVAIYSTFLQRAYDQILHDVCIQKAPVVFLLDRSGVVGEDGATHNGVYDISYLNHMPNMKILAPRDGAMFASMLDYAKDFNRGPIAIRYPKGEALELGYGVKDSLCGCGQFLKQGKKIAILAVGSMVELALQIAKSDDVGDITVADAVFVKPIDYCLINRLADGHEHLIIIEENSIIGGYASSVMSYLNTTAYDIKVHPFGIPDKFLKHGSRSEVLNEIGLNVANLSKYIRDLYDE